MPDPLRRLAVFLLAALLALPTVSRADDGGFLQDEIAQIDAWFGDWIVDPLAAVLFFDVVFWDNHLAPEAALGREVDGEVITDHTTEGYVYRRRYVLKDPVPAIEQPQLRRMGQLEVQVRNGFIEQAGRDPQPIVEGFVPSQPVDLDALGLERLDEQVADAQALVTTAELAPFPVVVDLRTGTTVATTISLPTDTIPVEPGTRVLVAPGEIAEVESMGADGAVAWSVDTRTDRSPVPNPGNAQLPIVVAWLVLGALFFTMRMRLVNLWGFGHAIAVTAGRYDQEGEEGEISHFQALSSALSATVGLGNIAGVAIAITIGGPGAVFWMMTAGFLGMASKFTECTLGQMYRIVRPDGTVSGGPMYYLDRGLAEAGWPRAFGKTLAVLFALMCIGGSLGGGNMFQANQSFAAVAEVVPWMADKSWLYGLVLATLVGLVILGGIKRIGAVAGLLVPFMCMLYVGAGIIIILMNADQIPAAMIAIFSQAFSPEAGFGGIVGVLATGFQRAAFSSEAGVGSASIAHSAASTRYPVREGIVALLEPFIDTIVVCATTALVVVITGVYTQQGLEGVVLTQAAFATVFSWFPMVLSVAVVLFAFSTMLSWSYYGERASIWLFGERALIPYRVIFLIFVWLGSVMTLGNAVAISDLMILGMAFPNILGAVLLSGKVKAALDEYWGKLKRGELEPRQAA